MPVHLCMNVLKIKQQGSGVAVQQLLINEMTQLASLMRLLINSGATTKKSLHPLSTTCNLWKGRYSKKSFSLQGGTLTDLKISLL